MALNEKSKKFIRDNPKLSSTEIASKLKKEIVEIDAYREELNTQVAATEIDPKRKLLFWSLTLAIPVLFFLFLEIGLRIGNYRGNTDLFLKGGFDTREFKHPNPNFAARYFFYTNVIPNASGDLFQSVKSDKIYRVFALGGSSTAGYPYGYNAMFSHMVREVLQDAMPDKQVEVINLGISAVNTYTIYDQVREILAEKPDAILIYAGHNEYYGALGVGSSESLGTFPALVRMYLRIQQLKTFMLLRDGIGRIGRFLAGGKQHSDTGTLMERVVREQHIPYESPLYELGKIQFKSNMKAIIKAFKQAGVDIYISNLVSNEKDHIPFESVAFGSHPPALEVYNKAQKAYESEEYEEAKKLFQYARDLDALRFRASTEWNDILYTMAKEHEVIFVDVEQEFRKESPHGIIGKELMLEHLHPNYRGYYLIGKAFSHAMLTELKKQGKTNLIHVKSWDHYFKQLNMTEFDLMLANKRVINLMKNWPFVKTGQNNSKFVKYEPGNLVDSLTSAVVVKDTNWEKAKVELASLFTQKGQYDKAIDEYKGLVRNQPYNESGLDRIAQLYLDRNEFENAIPYLQRSYKLYPGAFNSKMLGASYIHFGQATSGVKYLEESLTFNPNDAQALYNLSGGYFMLKQNEQALEVANKLLQINPRFPGGVEWRNQLQTLINK